MNSVIASKVVCCVPVPVSPEACDNCEGVSAANTEEMPPLVLKKLVSALPTFCWLMLRPVGTEKSINRLR